MAPGATPHALQMAASRRLVSSILPASVETDEAADDDQGRIDMSIHFDAAADCSLPDGAFCTAVASASLAWALAAAVMTPVMRSAEQQPGSVTDSAGHSSSRARILVGRAPVRCSRRRRVLQDNLRTTLVCSSQAQLRCVCWCLPSTSILVCCSCCCERPPRQRWR